MQNRIFKRTEDFIAHIRTLNDYQLLGIAKRIDRERFPERYQTVIEFLKGNRYFFPTPIPATEEGEIERERIIQMPIPEATVANNRLIKSIFGKLL